MPSSRADVRRGARFDVWLALSTVLLIVIGLMSLYSEGISRDGGADFRKQIVFTAIGLGPFLLFAVIHPNIWRKGAAILYGVNIASLTAVLIFGSKKKGADRWIEFGSIQVQPSEMAKLLTILTLAAFFAANQETIRKPSTFVMSFVHILPPLALILMQPHLGAAMVIVVSWFAVALVAGCRMRHIAIAFCAFALLAGSVLTIPAVASKVLMGYQDKRVIGLTSATGRDARNLNWQTDRAEIAFGMGGVLGSGFLKGEQKAGHFIPEQHNDFVFTIVGEEGGLIGCTMVLAAFGFFFYRVWLVMFLATEPFYKMTAGGILAALFFHTFVNIAMVLHLVPVVGLWLPFLSYGGTAMWLCMACVGLLINLRRRERPLLF